MEACPAIDIEATSIILGGWKVEIRKDAQLFMDDMCQWKLKCASVIICLV